MREVKDAAIIALGRSCRNRIGGARYWLAHMHEAASFG
jgi:hypothetical protein